MHTVQIQSQGSEVDAQFFSFSRAWACSQQRAVCNRATAASPRLTVLPCSRVSLNRAPGSAGMSHVRLHRHRRLRAPASRRLRAPASRRLRAPGQRGMPEAPAQANAAVESAAAQRRSGAGFAAPWLAAPRLAALPAVGSLWATATGQAGSHSPAATARTHVPKTGAQLARGPRVQLI